MEPKGPSGASFAVPAGTTGYPAMASNTLIVNSDPPQPCQVVKACMTLDARVTDVTERAGELERRLAPILRPVKPQDLAQRGDVELVPLAASLDDYASRLERCADMLASVIDRLEV